VQRWSTVCRSAVARQRGYHIEAGRPRRPNWALPHSASDAELFRGDGHPIRRGRAFDDRDDASHGRPAIINEGFARRFWPDGDPIGRRIQIGPKDTSRG